jgi:tetratricopeptide (TPR) repeat protein
VSRLYQARLRHARHFEGVLAEARELFASGGGGQQGGLARFEEERQNLFTAMRWASDLAGADDAAADLHIRFLTLGSQFLILRQPAAERARMLDAGVTAARRLGRLAFESLFLHQLSNAYFVTGDYQRAVELGAATNAVEYDLREIDDEALLLSYNSDPYADTARVTGEIDRKQAFYELTDLLHRHLEGITDAPAPQAETALRAIELAEAVLTGFRENGDKVSEAAALSALGMAYAEAGDFARAVEISQQGRRLYRELTDRRGEADLVGRLVWFYATLDDVRTASDLAAEALTLYRQAKDAGREMLAHATLGVLRSLTGEHRAAVEQHQRALELARGLGDSVYEAVILGQLAVCAEQLGDREQMLARSEEATAVLERAGREDAALLRRSLEAERARGT